MRRTPSILPLLFGSLSGLSLFEFLLCGCAEDYKNGTPAELMEGMISFTWDRGYYDGGGWQREPFCSYLADALSLSRSSSRAMRAQRGSSCRLAFCNAVFQSRNSRERECTNSKIYMLPALAWFAGSMNFGPLRCNTFIELEVHC